MICKMLIRHLQAELFASDIKHDSSKQFASAEEGIYNSKFFCRMVACALYAESADCRNACSRSIGTVAAAADCFGCRFR